MADVLVATLGRSPGAVTGLYNLLMQEGTYRPAQVRLLMTSDPDVQEAATIIEAELVKRFGIDPEVVRREEFEEPDLRGGLRSVLAFQKRVTAVLEELDGEGHRIITGIAGGRSSMGAMLAVSSQLYDTVREMYHVWVDRKLEGLGDIEWLRKNRNHPLYNDVLFPPTNRCKLVPLPVYRLATKRAEIEKKTATELQAAYANASAADRDMVNAILAALPHHMTIDQARRYLHCMGEIAAGHNVEERLAEALEVLQEAGGASLQEHFEFLREQAGSGDDMLNVMARFVERVEADSRVWWGRRLAEWWKENYEPVLAAFQVGEKVVHITGAGMNYVLLALFLTGKYWMAVT